MQQLLAALAALHDLGIVHRDIKPENLMVDGLDHPATLRLTLIDFGYADVKCGGADLERLAGSPEYAAPEVLSWLTEEGEPYDCRCDVWSTGITAHVLISGGLPFEIPDDADEDEIAEIAKSAALLFDQAVWTLDGMDEPKAFVCACLTANPALRPTAHEASMHSWLTAPAAPAEGSRLVSAASRAPQDEETAGDHSC